MRTTLEKVRSILENKGSGVQDTELLEFISSASVFIDNAFVNVSATESILAEIERWLAAHLYTAAIARSAKEEGAGGAYIKYAGEFGAGLLSTSYGQTAVSMDISGTLAALTDTKRKTATFRTIYNGN